MFLGNSIISAFFHSRLGFYDVLRAHTKFCQNPDTLRWLKIALLLLNRRLPCFTEGNHVFKYVFLSLRRQLRCQAEGKNSEKKPVKKNYTFFYRTNSNCFGVVYVSNNFIPFVYRRRTRHGSVRRSSGRARAPSALSVDLAAASAASNSAAPSALTPAATPSTASALNESGFGLLPGGAAAAGAYVAALGSVASVDGGEGESENESGMPSNLVRFCTCYIKL
jgi:hypothetical protein